MTKTDTTMQPFFHNDLQPSPRLQALLDKNKTPKQHNRQDLLAHWAKELFVEGVEHLVGEENISLNTEEATLLSVFGTLTERTKHDIFNTANTEDAILTWQSLQIIAQRIGLTPYLYNWIFLSSEGLVQKHNIPTMIHILQRCTQDSRFWDKLDRVGRWTREPNEIIFALDTWSDGHRPLVLQNTLIDLSKKLLLTLPGRLQRLSQNDISNLPTYDGLIVLAFAHHLKLDNVQEFFQKASSEKPEMKANAHAWTLIKKNIQVPSEHATFTHFLLLQKMGRSSSSYLDFCTKTRNRHHKSFGFAQNWVGRHHHLFA